MNIGSFLYNVAIECLQESAPVDNKNQNFLPHDLKIKPRGIPLRATGTTLSIHSNLKDSFTDNKLFEVEKEPTRDSEIIEGFFSKQQMKYFFEEKADMYSQ